MALERKTGARGLRSIMVRVGVQQKFLPMSFLSFSSFFKFCTFIKKNVKLFDTCTNTNSDFIFFYFPLYRVKAEMLPLAGFKAKEDVVLTAA